MIALTPGRPSTRSRTQVQPRLGPASRRRCSHLPSHGIRPLSRRSPSSASVAGRTVSEPRTATATTRIVASAMPMNVCWPVRNMPAMAAITVSPETSTERPDVAAAMSTASSVDRPAARSSRCRRM